MDRYTAFGMAGIVGAGLLWSFIEYRFQSRRICLGETLAVERSSDFRKRFLPSSLAVRKRLLPPSAGAKVDFYHSLLDAVGRFLGKLYGAKESPWAITRLPVENGPVLFNRTLAAIIGCGIPDVAELHRTATAREIAGLIEQSARQDFIAEFEMITSSSPQARVIAFRIHVSKWVPDLQDPIFRELFEVCFLAGVAEISRLFFRALERMQPDQRR